MIKSFLNILFDNVYIYILQYIYFLFLKNITKKISFLGRSRTDEWGFRSLPWRGLILDERFELRGWSQNNLTCKSKEPLHGTLKIDSAINVKRNNQVIVLFSAYSWRCVSERAILHIWPHSHVRERLIYITTRLTCVRKGNK